MIETVKIFNRFNMNMFVSTEGINFPYKDKPWSLISIYTEPEEEFLIPSTKKFFQSIGMKDSLSLCFWDIDDSPKVFEDYPNAILFNEEHAKLILGMLVFADQYDEAVLVVHCDAGISRSGAVGSFAVDFLGLDYNQFKRQNPDIHPNIFVYNILRRAAMKNDRV